MRNENSSTIILRLKDSKHMFVSSETPPFGVDGLPVSGMDYLFNQLSVQKSLSISNLRIQFPEPLSPTFKFGEIDQQIKRYCCYKIELINNEKSELTREGLHALQSGGLFLAVSLLLATLVQRFDLLPDLLQEFVIEGLLIVGWVGLWHPIEILIYGLWPYRKEKKIYEHIANMEIELVPDKSVE